MDPNRTSREAPDRPIYSSHYPRGNGPFSAPITSQASTVFGYPPPVIYPSFVRYGPVPAAQSPYPSQVGFGVDPSRPTSASVGTGRPFDAAASLMSEGMPRSVGNSSGGPRTPFSSHRRVEASFESSSRYSENIPNQETNSSPNFSRPSPTNSTASQHSPVPSTHRKAHMAQSVPSGFGHLLHPQPSSSPPPAVPSRPRLRLFIRQQPTQARACGAGDKCRRPVDPLPIVQLLMMDFSPHSEEDARHLISPQYVVACQLYSIPKGHEDDSDGQLLYPSTAEHYLDRSQAGRVSGDPGSELQTRQVRILSGSIHASSFSVDEDPEPARAPSHPRSAPNSEINPAIHSGPIPAVFFIFPDLCVRTAGHYRLRFSLIDIVSTMSGHPQWAPILHEAWSQPFQVFPAKDFPGMKATPYLTMQLKTLGASGITTRKEPRGQRGRMDTQSGSEEQNEGDED